ncbi:MAG: sulfite exporter TauE/SafE family protein [Chloroflexi bacterium]|nr:sulfite exporter TauE/SafE family protein [Chloroflexota bacterium]
MTTDIALNWIFLLLPLVGFLVGFLVTVVGGGGGLIYVPVLTILFDLPTQLAVATSLASIIPTTVFGSIGHHRQGNINLPVGIVFAVGGIAGVFIGAYISSLISSALLGKLFGALTLALVFPMAISRRQRARRRSSVDAQPAATAIPWAKGTLGSIFGVSSGVMAGLFGVSGTPPVVAGLYILGLSAHVVVGTSVFVLLFNAVFGLIGHLLLSQLNLALVLLTGSGAAVGATVGPRFLGRVKSSSFEKFYGPFSILMALTVGITMITR